MRLQLKAASPELQVNEDQPVTSRSTGRSLRRYKARFRVAENLAEDVTKQLRDARTSNGALADDEAGRWVVEEYNYSFGDADSWRTYRVTLREVQDTRVLQQVAFEGFEFDVEWYNDEFPGDKGDGPLLILVEFSTTAQVEARLTDFIIDALDGDEPQYFDLVRRGLTDDPIRVRLGPMPRSLSWSRRSVGSSRRGVAAVAGGAVVIWGHGCFFAGQAGSGDDRGVG